ncbi:MAG: hypothetical protein U9O24_01955 [Campylobacterota bacterium]|nr:hypothetical protein [Campylobacterota bacterium]
MKHILLTVILLFSLTACQDNKEEQAKHDAKVAQEAREQLLQELKLKEEQQKEEESKNNKLAHMGISTYDGKITIDTNKTQHFFKDIANKLKDRMHKINEDLKDNTLDHKEAGIQIDKGHVSIDLNKTKSFLDHWGIKMKVFAQEFNDLAKEFDNNTK